MPQESWQKKNKPNDDDKKWYNGKSYTVEEKEVIEQ